MLLVILLPAGEFAEYGLDAHALLLGCGDGDGGQRRWRVAAVGRLQVARRSRPASQSLLNFRAQVQLAQVADQVAPGRCTSSPALEEARRLEPTFAYFILR